MKIVFDHQIFGWQKYGGVSRYAFEVAKELTNFPSNLVAVICPFYVNSYLAAAPSRLRVYGIRVKPFPRSGRIYRAINTLFAWLIMRLISPDIVHETYYSSVRIAPKNSKIVLTVYDMIHERFVENFSKADPTSKEKMAAVTRADHIICISEQTRKDLIELFGINPSKTTVIHLGFSLTTTYKDTKLIKFSKPYVLYVGGRGGYKNFESLLKAYAKSSIKSDYDLICFGGGNFTLHDKKLIDSLNLTENQVIQISGDDALLADYYHSAEMFVYPSLYEGFGIPPLEAMSFDCPVVCSNLSSIPEVVGDAGYYFDPNNVEDIQRALEVVVRSDQIKDDLRRKGKERIKYFSWEKCAAKTLEVYNKLV